VYVHDAARVDELLPVEFDALLFGLFLLAVRELSLSLERTEALNWRQRRLAEVGQEGSQTLQLTTGIEGRDGMRCKQVNFAPSQNIFKTYASLVAGLVASLVALVPTLSL
jgi:hypothetical protein